MPLATVYLDDPGNARALLPKSFIKDITNLPEMLLKPFSPTSF